MMARARPPDDAPCLQQELHHLPAEAGAGGRASMAWWQEYRTEASQNELQSHCPLSLWASNCSGRQCFQQWMGQVPQPSILC